MSVAGSDRIRWLVSLGVVLVVHGLGAWAVLWWATRSPPLADDSPMDAVMVELAPEPESPPAPPTEIPPGPPQQEQTRPEPLPTPRPESRAKTPTVDSPAVQDPAQQEDPPDEDPSTEETAAAQALALPQVSARPSDDYAAQQTVSGTTGQAVVTWQSVLLGHLGQYRRYPRQAERQRQQGVAYVRFSVDRQGNVTHPRIGRSSGHPLLDEETLATVRRASPVPPPPADVKGDPVEVMVPVSFFLRTR